MEKSKGKTGIKNVCLCVVAHAYNHTIQERQEDL
jgi:hypothetical protein